MLQGVGEDLSYGTAPSAPLGRSRFCIANRTVRPTGDMVRFVVGPGRKLVPDLERKLPGRGTWITARRALVVRAVKRGSLARGLGNGVAVPSDLADRLEVLLERSALDALGKTRKAGLAILEFSSIIKALSGGKGAPSIRAVLSASKARGAAAVELAVALRTSKGECVEIIDGLSCAQLDLAFGRLDVVHAALIAGRASETFLARWRIFKSFRADEPDL